MADEFAIKVSAQLETAIEHLEKRATFLEDRGAEEGTVGQTRNKIEDVRKLVTGHDVAVRLRVPFAAPAIGKAISLEELPIAVQLGGTVDGTYRHARPLLVHLVED